jgi:putative peptidoglycan lipid II flippase
VFLIYLVFFSKNTNIAILMGVSVIAASTQFLIQLPAVRHLGYRYSLNVNLNDPYLKKAMILIFPVLIGSAVQQINVIIDKTLASDLVRGSISALTYSSRINELVISVFIAAIATVVFPMLSSAFSRNEEDVVKDIFKQGVNIILIITIPATIGIMLLAKPMVFLFFQRGAFDDLATTMTSGALVFYSIGLVGASLRLMLNKVFYSFQDTKTPMINGAIAVVLNLVLNFAFIGTMQHRGLALATSLSTTISTVFLFLALRKKLGPLGMGNMFMTFIKTLVSAVIMGVVVYLMYFKLGALLPDVKIIQMIMLLVSVAVGAIVYFIFCILFKIKEMRVLVRGLVRR